MNEGVDPIVSARLANCFVHQGYEFMSQVCYYSLSNNYL